jgi:hypothetical protein
MNIKRYTYLFVFALAMATGGAVVLYKSSKLIGPAANTFVVIASLAVAIFALTRLKWEFKPENTYQKIVVIVFFLYVLVTIMRGLPKGYTETKALLTVDYLFWVYIIPLFIFFDKRLITLAYLMKATYFLAVFFLLMCVVRPSLILERLTAEPFIHPFVFGCGFLLLNARYLPKARKRVAAAAMIIGVCSFIYLARRNGVVSYGCLIMAAIALNAKFLSASKLFRIIPVGFCIVAMGLLSTDSLPKSFTKRLNDRITEDSRSGVFDYFFRDMDKGNQIFGKGMQGAFYYPHGGHVDEYDNLTTFTLFRNVIENGYLQLYLNGGIVYVILFLLVLLPAAVLGIFKSSNQLTQAAGIVVFLWLLDMVIYGMPRLTFEYVLVWICAGICYKKSLRETPDEEIAEFFDNFNNDESTLVY